MSKSLAIAAAVAVLLGLGTAAAFVFFAPNRQCGGSVIAGGTASIGGPFTLVDQTGRTVTDADVIDGPTLVYFGYTYCPDVCPVDTARNAEAVELLKDRGLDVTPVFITVDPARDTPEVLADYVSYLSDGMIGLTGTPDQIAVAAKAYKAFYRKGSEDLDYLMDHSTFTYLMDPTGFIDVFRRDETAQQMADRVACYVD